MNTLNQRGLGLYEISPSKNGRHRLSPDGIHGRGFEQGFRGR